MDDKEAIKFLDEESNFIIDDKISEYIKKELKKGFSKELIKEFLIKAGHSPEKVDFHFKSHSLSK